MNAVWIKQVIHQQRFFVYPFLTVLLIIGYFYLKPLAEQLGELFNQEENLTTQLTEREKAMQSIGGLSLKVNIQTSNPLVVLRQLMTLAKFNYLETSRVTWVIPPNSQKADQPADGLTIILVVTGEFAGLLGFIEQFHQQKYPLNIDHVLIKNQDDHLVCTLQLTLFPRVLALTPVASAPPHQQLASKSRDPFATGFLLTDRLPALTTNHSGKMSLEQLRYLGYLRQGSKIVALLLLPEGGIAEVDIGAVITPEKWRVQSIDPKKVSLLSDDQHHNKQLIRE